LRRQKEKVMPCKKALLFLGHGSRAREANEAMYGVIDLVREATDFDIVEAGFLDLNPPSVTEAMATCVRQGADRVLVMPYFLHLGMHVQRDLPRVIAELQAEHPQVEVVLGRHIGFHPKLAEIFVERIQEMEQGLLVAAREDSLG